MKTFQCEKIEVGNLQTYILKKIKNIQTFLGRVFPGYKLCWRSSHCLLSSKTFAKALLVWWTVIETDLFLFHKSFSENPRFSRAATLHPLQFLNYATGPLIGKSNFTRSMLRNPTKSCERGIQLFHCPQMNLFSDWKVIKTIIENKFHNFYGLFQNLRFY